MKTKVFVTGIGVVSCAGIGKDAFWHTLLEGQDATDFYEPLTETDCLAEKAGFISDFDTPTLLSGYNHRRFSRYNKFIIAGIELAIKDSGIDLDDIPASRKGLIFETFHGASETTEAFLDQLYHHGPATVSPLMFSQTVSNAPATPVSIKYHLQGISTVIFGTSAILMAYDYLNHDQADVIVCGGGDALILTDRFHTLSDLGLLAHRNSVAECSCPGDIKRNGLIWGEGAGFVVLETAASVRKRRSGVYCEIAGYGAAHDHDAVKAYNQRRSEPVAYAMAAALQDAGIEPGDIQYINSMANSCHGIDEVEAQAIKRVFTNYDAISVSTFKGSTGETDGASDAFGIIQASLTLKTQTIAPIANLENIDPLCGLNYVRTKKHASEVEYALSNSFGDGGNVQSVVLKKYGERR